jgi:hypothetical protein
MEGLFGRRGMMAQTQLKRNLKGSRKPRSFFVGAHHNGWFVVSNRQELATQ